MERTLICETPKKAGEKVKLAGWVNIKRDHGKITFIDLKDRSGIVQLVGDGKNLGSLRAQDAIEVEGKVKERPEKLINPKIKTGKVEVEVEKVKVLSNAHELPFDMGKEELTLELPTLLDHRPLTLRHPKQTAIFKVQAQVAESFRKAAIALNCTEIFVPTIAVSSTEGGSEVFRVDYYEHKAYLTQSPQLYKQIMVGALERVYTFSHAYRAEPSVTTRHISETVQMDCEIGFIESFDELLDAVEFAGKEMISDAAKECESELKILGVEAPLIPHKVPRLKLREAQKIVEQRTGKDLSHEMDLNSEDEKELGAWARETHKSDLVIVTHYPTKKRAFYTMPDPSNPEYSLSYDMIFKGLEILSGSQRINDYDQLVGAIKDRGMNPEDFEIYLQAFKYGMPPEGGFSFGLERVTMKLLNLENVREASLFPRDMERVDIRLSTLNSTKPNKK
ncbi:MAG TPA: aspartate--tRNA(Asn) ligase [Patescibacteria group bacterium]